MGKAKKGGKRLTKKELVQKLADLFQLNPKDKFPLKVIFRKLDLDTHPLKMLCMDIIFDLLDEGILIQPENNVYQLKPISYSKTDKEEDIDIEIDTFVGELQVYPMFAFLKTDGKILSHDIFIPLDKLKDGKTGEKAVARILRWPEGYKNPIGEVIDVLGKKGDNNTEMHAILAEYGLPYFYPENVEAEANKIPNEIPEQEIARREDFRNVTTFTIDPKDAKDFDDALSIRRIGNLWEVGVHIADVTYYVKENSIIDKEAFNRATSVYLVDRTIPMLPEHLCNFLCSLRQDEDKVAYSVILLMNDEAEIKDYRIVHTMIRSNRRFCYEEVQEILEKNGVATQYDEGKPRPEPHTHDEYIKGERVPEGEFALELIALDKLAKKLREKRFKNGSIDFHSHEAKFELDETGKPIRVYFKYSKDANKLIEEFMLQANRTVAEHIGKPSRINKKPKTFVYRVHDIPDLEKLDNLSQFISRFGYRLKTTGEKSEISKNLNAMLHDIIGKPEETLIETVSLRAMQKAKYSTENIGHYGLNFDYYTHFTSPIRRYPDMMVHRLLTRYLEAKGRSAAQDKFEERCEHSSAMEQTASSAERSSIKYKQVEFMQDHLGQEFQGTVSGITEWGLYVEIDENKCEGMVPIRNLGEDFFDFDERNFRLVGSRTGRIFNLGDSLRIKVARADLEKRQLDFDLADSEKEYKVNPLSRIPERKFSLTSKEAKRARKAERRQKKLSHRK